MMTIFLSQLIHHKIYLSDESGRVDKIYNETLPIERLPPNTPVLDRPLRNSCQVKTKPREPIKND